MRQVQCSTFKNRHLSSYQLAKLHTFEVVARHCSFARAADELALTSSAVSHRIKQLEDELGVLLFYRYNRSIELTLEGKKIYAALSHSLQYLNEEILDIHSQDISGELTIYTRPSLAQCWLIPKISDFIERYPFIQLTILTGNEQVNLHGAGMDLAIYYDTDQHKDLACVELMDEWIMPVCSPEYAEKFNLYNNIAQLHHCTLLHDRQAWSLDSNGDEWKMWCDSVQFSLGEHHKNIGFDRSDLAVIAAINHAGVAIGRKHLVDKRLKNKELVVPFAQAELKCKQRYYVLTSQEYPKRKVQVFIEWLQQQVVSC